MLATLNPSVCEEVEVGNIPIIGSLQGSCNVLESYSWQNEIAEHRLFVEPLGRFSVGGKGRITI